MIVTELTQKALTICREAHGDQLDQGSHPYAEHPMRVAEKMTDENTVCTALLHDVLEDTQWTADDLRREGFPEKVVQAVCATTHLKDQPYMDYIRSIKCNPVAAQVKLADLQDNIDLSRLKRVDDLTLRRTAKYAQAMYILLDQTNRGLAEWAEAKIKTVIAQSPHDQNRGYAYWHVMLVFQFAVLFALRRGENHELAAVAGLLHDIHTFSTGDSTCHGPKGAEMLARDEECRRMLSSEELASVCQAISRHSAKDRTDAPLDECLKDADTMAHNLESAGRLGEVETRRFEAICRELGIQ